MFALLMVDSPEGAWVYFAAALRGGGLFLENGQLQRGQGHIIQVDTVPAAGVERHLRADSAWLEELLFSTYMAKEPPAEVYYRAERIGDNLELRGEISMTLGFACNRCGEEAVCRPKFSLEALFIPRDVTRSEAPVGDELEECEIEVDSQASDEIFVGEIIDGGADIADAMVDAVVLGLLPYPLCHDDCKGLCAGCGANRNFETCTCADHVADNRWAKLAELKAKLPKK